MHQGFKGNWERDGFHEVGKFEERERSIRQRKTEERWIKEKFTITKTPIKRKISETDEDRETDRPVRQKKTEKEINQWDRNKNWMLITQTNFWIVDW